MKWNALKCMSMFLFLCTLLSASVFYGIYPSIKTSYDENIDNVKNALANIKIVDGKIQPLKDKSIEIKDKEGNVFAILSAKAIDINKLKNLLFTIEGQRLSIYQNGDETSFNLSNMDFGNNSKFTSLANVIPSWDFIKYCILPTTIFFTSISICLWNVLMLATFAFIVDMPHRLIGFYNSIKLAITASTPAVIINLVYAIFFSKILPESAMMIITVVVLYYVIVNIIKELTQQHLYQNYLAKSTYL